MIFGLWLDRPGHQDGALGHHAGVLHDSPGIMQALHDFHESCRTSYSMLLIGCKKIIDRKSDATEENFHDDDGENVDGAKTFFHSRLNICDGSKIFEKIEKFIWRS